MTSYRSIAAMSLALAISAPVDAQAQMSMQEDLELFREQLPEGATLTYGATSGSPYDGEGVARNVVIENADENILRMQIGTIRARNFAMSDDDVPEAFELLEIEDVVIDLVNDMRIGAQSIEFRDIENFASALQSQDRLASLSSGPARISGIWFGVGANQFEIADVVYDRIENGKLSGMAINDVTFEGFDPDEGKPISVSLERMAYDWFRIDTGYWSEYAKQFENLGQPAGAEEIVESLELTANMADTFGPFRMDKLRFEADDIKFLIEGINSEIHALDGGGFGMSFDMKEAGLESGTMIEGENFDDIVAELGFNPTVFDWSMAMTGDEAGGRLAIDSFRLNWRDVVATDFAMEILGDEPLKQLTQLQNATEIDIQNIDIGLGSAFLKLTAGPQFETMLEIAAQEQGLAAEHLPAMIVGPLAGFNAALPEPSARLDNVAQAVSQFFQSPGTLSIEVNPNQPLRFQDLMFGAMVAPGQLLETLNLQALSVAGQ